MIGLRFEKISKEQSEKDGIVHFYESIVLPKRATAFSAGYDFFAPYDLEIKKGESVLVPSGVKAKMPQDTVLLILPRSSLGFKYKLRLCNTVGVIDSDYYGNEKNEGHIMIKLFAEGNDVTIPQGKAFAQGIFLKYYTTEDDETDKQRQGGMGSTN